MEEQRRLARALAEADPTELPPSYVQNVQRLAELVLALDEWRAAGGFEPVRAAPGNLHFEEE